VSGKRLVWDDMREEARRSVGVEGEVAENEIEMLIVWIDQ
jgi:hypothetical protein